MTNRIEAITEILRKEYPDAATALAYSSPFELLVATILAAQCTDARVNKVTPGLFKKYKNVHGFAKAKQEQLEKDIHSTGFFRNKAKNIIAMSKMLIKTFNGKVPDSMEQLVTLPGVARKTANIVLTHCFHKAEGIAVDTHVARLSQRLEFTTHTDPNKIEQDLMRLVPKKYWRIVNSLLVDHGRAVCKARKPLCDICCIAKYCPAKQ